MSATDSHPSLEIPNRIALRLAPDERELLARVREVVAAEIAPRAAEVDQHKRFPAEGYQALARAGLAGLLMPVEFGGQGASTVLYAAAMEEIAAACGSTSTVYMTQMHCAHPIALAGTDDQRARFIPGLCSGEMYGAIAITEPDAGSDVSSIRTVARRENSGYVLNGQKTFITSGDQADVVVLFATIDRSGGRQAFTSFLVEKGTEGFSSGPPMNKMGQRGSSTVELSLIDCWVPLSSRLGDEGTAYQLSMRSVVKSRISAAAQGVGFARAAFERAARWAHEEGLLSGSNRHAQDVQFALADMRSSIEAGRALLSETAALVDAHPGDPITEVAVAKLHCTDLGMDIASRAMDLLGIDGDRVDLGIERIYRDVKVTQIYDGTNQVQRMLIARDIRTTQEEARNDHR